MFIKNYAVREKIPKTRRTSARPPCFRASALQMRNPYSVCPLGEIKLFDLLIDKVVFHRDSNSFQARVHLEFLKDMLNVISHRIQTEG